MDPPWLLAAKRLLILHPEAVSEEVFVPMKGEGMFATVGEHEFATGKVGSCFTDLFRGKARRHYLAFLLLDGQES
jgi:hypothetical protein